MLLYSLITVALFAVLIISITDCRSNQVLIKKSLFYFSKPFYNFFFISLLLLFWFLTAFRGSTIGNDTQTYLNYYRDIAKSGVNPKYQIELGYQYFCLFLSKISTNPFTLLLVSSTICYVICGICIYKYSHNILYSTILLFCVAFAFFASGIRQSIAMVIVLIAYFKIKEGKTLLPLCLILLASVFHISAFVVLLWFAHKYISKNPLITMSAAIIASILSALGLFNSLLANLIKEYANYFETERVGSGWGGVAYYVLRALVFYFFIYVANCKNKNEKEKSLEITNSIFLLGTACLGFAINLFTRASLYFLLITVIDLPNAFNSGKIRNRSSWMFITGVVMLAFFIVTLILRPEWNYLYPYEFNWS